MARLKIKGGVPSKGEAQVINGRLRVAISGGGGSTTNHNLLLNNPAPNDDHTQYFHIDGRRALTGDLSMGGNDIDSASAIAIDIAGTDELTIDTGSVDLTGGGQLQIRRGTGVGLLVGSDVGSDVTITNATQKVFRMGHPHYTNAEQPMGIFIGTSAAASSSLFLGGGTSSFNAVTQLSIYAAANTTTTTGTEMFRVTTVGVRVEPGVAGVPAYLLHVVSGASGAAANANADDLVIEGSGVAGMSILSPTSGFLYFGDVAEPTTGRLSYFHNTNYFEIRTGAVARMRIGDGVGVRIENGVAAAATFPLHVVGQAYINQSAAAGAVPCLELDQDDTDREFIEFDGNAAASAATSISTWTAGSIIQGHIQVTINGVKRWLRFYDDPTS